MRQAYSPHAVLLLGTTYSCVEHDELDIPLVSQTAHVLSGECAVFTDGCVSTGIFG